jgi:hypothetical protein
MVQYVTGASPVTFISEDTVKNGAGTQYQIPLPLISYNTAASGGPVVLSAWPQSTTIAASDVTLAQTLILTMINQGVLTLVSTADA